MTISLYAWTPADKSALMALCNAVGRTFLSNLLPYPYTEADADWWVGMVAANEGKEGVWRSIWVDGQLVGSISVERKAGEEHTVGELGKKDFSGCLHMKKEIVTSQIPNMIIYVVILDYAVKLVAQNEISNLRKDILTGVHNLAALIAAKLPALFKSKTKERL